MTTLSHPIGDKSITRLKKPRDAATLLLVDRDDGSPKVLMGRRSNRHIFMPNIYAFPGGSRDRGDSRVNTASLLSDHTIEKLCADTHNRFTIATAHALGVAAARELMEETNLFLGPIESSKNAINLSNFDLKHMHFFARAITPTGFARRFDTRFFICFCDEVRIDLSTIHESQELTNLTWVTINSPSDIEMADITKTVLQQLAKALSGNHNLTPNWKVPFYRQIGKNSVCSTL